MTFGRYLAAQKVRDDWIGELARAAAKDPRFPWSAEPLDIFDHVRRHMGGEDATVLHAVQAAIDEWNEGPYSLVKAEQALRDVKREDDHAAASARYATQDKRDRRNARRRKLYALRKGASAREG